MPTRRPILKRVAVWTAGVLLAFVLYLAGAPLVIFTVLPRFPAIVPVFKILYGPIDYYGRQDGWPGSHSYRNYVEWCRDRLMPRPPALPPAPQPARPLGRTAR